MVERNDRIESFQKEPDGVDSVFQDRAVDKDNADFRKSQPVLFTTAIILSIVILIVLYCCSSLSRVRAISVSGNDYLSVSYIQKICGVSLNDMYYLQFPEAVAETVEKDPAVESAKVTMLVNNVIHIEIKEKQPIGYRYDSDQPIVLFSDGTAADLTSDYMPMISRIPYIEGFDDEEQTHLLTQAFADVNRSMIEEMAQISQYALSYDSQALEIQMRDGGIFFASYYTLDMINEYWQYAANVKDKNNCFYADTEASVVSARACPWNTTPISYEYWTDADGNYITNKWGDRAIKHYYRDANGGYYTTPDGSYIPIPIDEYGNEVPDQDFLNHYLLGYYDTGTLVIPPETTEDEGTDQADEGTDQSQDETGTDQNTDAQDQSGSNADAQQG